jgi:hypothetical protein
MKCKKPTEDVEMDFGLDDPIKKYRVLKAVEEQCRPKLDGGRLGKPWEGKEAVQLSVDGLEAEEISDYCFILNELGLIKTVTFHSIDGDFVYPVKLTRLGSNFTREADQSLLDNAKLVAVDLLKQWTGIDLNHPASKALYALFQKYKQQRV